MAEKPSRPEWVRDLGLFSVIVIDVVGYTGAGIALGYLAWTELHLGGWTVVVGAMAGLCLAMYRVVRITKVMREKGK